MSRVHHICNQSVGCAKPANVAKDANRFLGQLEPVLPGGSANWNGRATSSLPALDPNLGLAYSYWRKGQYTQFAGYEKVPQGHVYFAGEHCSIDFQGFMEGGATEGARAANEVLAAVSGFAKLDHKKSNRAPASTVAPAKKSK